MTEKLSPLLSLKQITKKYPAQDNFSNAKDPITGKMMPVFSRVHRNAEKQIVYVEPRSILLNFS